MVVVGIFLFVPLACSVTGATNFLSDLEFLFQPCLHFQCDPVILLGLSPGGITL